MALANKTTGKYVSERHAEATSNGLLTAGQIAKKMRKIGMKVKAAELKPYANEWHHSGFYKGSNGSTMGRTYFFRPNTDLRRLYEQVLADRQETARIEAEPDVERFFFVTRFRKRYGRRRGWQPVARFEAKMCKPTETFDNSTEISKKDYDLLKQFDGKDLYAYENVSEFKKRMLS